jgi:GDP-mannose 6-dehydrogenase
MARVSVFGLGYIGCVTAACLARAGHEVLGVDVSREKVSWLNDGVATVREPGLDALVREAHAAGRLRATGDAREAVLASTHLVVCVGTPGKDSGALDTAAVERVAAQIGETLGEARARGEGERRLIMVRSTVLPGTSARLVIPALERASGGRAGVDFDVCVAPEFLRAGSAIADFASPPFLLVGSASLAVATEVQRLFASAAPLRAVAVETAEMAKYAFNAWRAVKVAFANDVAAIAEAAGVAGQEVMELVCADAQLNCSAAYLRPGFAFGGSCLPKDLRALAYRAVQLDVESALLHGALASNARQIERAAARVATTGKRRIAVLGLTFKAGTDDLRESPAVALVERLLGKGYAIRIWDPELASARLVGANRAYIERELPHLDRLLGDELEEVLAASEVIVVTRAGVADASLLDRVAPRPLIDLSASLDLPGGRRPSP